MGTERERARFLENAEKSVKKGKFQEAIREYQKVLAVDPRDINVRNLLSDLYLRTNQKDRAIEEMYKIASYYEERGSYSQSMAVYKKINKLNPGNIESTMKLADLYYSQGFLSEAKSEYSKIAKGLMNNNRTREAIFLYEKLLKLDKKDVQTRIALADLYTREGEVDKAVARYNEAAEFKIRSGAFKEAHEILKKAKDLEEDNSRTLSNFVALLKKENKNKEARKLIDGILKKNKDDVTALRLLGNLHFEEKDFERAEAVFAQVISLRSKDVEARVKLGRIRIFQENLDEAFKLYKPLVETLVKKQKSEKAVGLLGLILSAKKVHTPTLEELASVYKSVGQKKNQEIVCRVLLEEYRKENKQKEYVSTLGGLVSLCPEDKELAGQYSQLGERSEIPEAPMEAELAEEEKLKAEEEVKRAEEERMRAEEVKEKAEEERERTEEGAKRAEEERMRAEAEARRAAEEEAQRTAEEEARKKVEEGAKWAEEGARRAEGEAKRAEEAARKAAGEEARRKVEEEARKKAEEQAQRAEGEMKRAEEHRMRAGEEARKAEEERRRAEDERKRAEEEVKKAVEVRMRLEEQARKAEEEAKRAEEERKRADEERIRAEEEAKRAAEEEAKRAAEEEDRIKAEEEAQKAAEEERRKMEEALEAEKITRVSTEEIKELEDIIEEKKAEEPSEPEGGTDESLEMNLAQAELYINQGLLRNAKRILENLRIQFPNEPRIGETLTSLGKLSSQVSADEILERVSEVSEKESELFDREGDSKDETEEPEDVEEKEEKVEEEVEEPVPEVKEPEPGKIPQEKEDVEAKAEKAEPSKKKEEVKKEVQNDDYMAHFQSGMSFLEKGQTDQAIEKFKLASKEESLKEECFHSLSHCFRQKEEFLEAAKWLKKAQELTEEGTDQFLALSYELASLYEEADEAEKAVALYDEIKKYDPKYRDVKKKTKILKKSLK
ncbi:MAG: tetratricopeptide repeat protein [Candidatus Aminicenantes bacterium]|nr:MAG: tetratricopeptide repeat protein [Candidatus Aminicenantes bacterium]